MMVITAHDDKNYHWHIGCSVPLVGTIKTIQADGDELNYLISRNAPGFMSIGSKRVQRVHELCAEMAYAILISENQETENKKNSVRKKYPFAFPNHMTDKSIEIAVESAKALKQVDKVTAIKFFRDSIRWDKADHKPGLVEVKEFIDSL